MIQIDDTIVSLDIFKQQFLCDFQACKGICCVEGESGAPLDVEEIDKLKEVLPVIWEDLSSEAQAIIDKQGVAYVDEDGDWVTSIVNGKDCVFTCYDDKGNCLCAIEKAYREGKIDWQKPISCHLYPIRLSTVGQDKLTALNYHRWPVCDGACKLGREKGVAIYESCKDALIRRFGERWYEELVDVARELKEQGYI